MLQRGDAPDTCIGTYHYVLNVFFPTLHALEKHAIRALRLDDELSQPGHHLFEVKFGSLAPCQRITDVDNAYAGDQLADLIAFIEKCTSEKRHSIAAVRLTTPFGHSLVVTSERSKQHAHIHGASATSRKPRFRLAALACANRFVVAGALIRRTNIC